MQTSDENRPSLALPDGLQPQELARVEEIRRGVLQGGERSLLQFGVPSQGKVAGVADAILAQVRGRDARQVGESLSALLDAVGAIDVGSLAAESPLASIPWIGGMFGAMKRFARRYEKLSTQVGRVVAELDRARAQLLRDMVLLDGLAEKNGENLRDLELHILAGRRLIEEVGRVVAAEDGAAASGHGREGGGELPSGAAAPATRDGASTGDIPAVRGLATDGPGGPMVDGIQVPAPRPGNGHADIAAFSDTAAASAASFGAEVREFRDRLGRRIHDLELSRMVAIQTAAQVRLVQGNNQILVERIQSSILNTIPMWKSQIVIALSLFRQRKALEVQGQVADATGELLRRNAEMLRQSTVDAARESERGIVSIEALRQVNGELVTTIEETLRIQREGRARRREVEAELRRLEAELRDRLREAAAEPREMA